MKQNKINPEVKKTYGKDFHCNNCGHDFTDYFEYGTRAYQRACPYCGCVPLNDLHIMDRYYGADRL